MDAIRLLSVAIRAIGFLTLLLAVSTLIDFAISSQSAGHDMDSGLVAFAQNNTHGITALLLGLISIVFADLFARMCFGQFGGKQIDLWGDRDLKADEDSD